MILKTSIKDYTYSEILEYSKSMLFGLSVGDALGVPVEFVDRETLKDNPITDMTEYGTWNQPKGTWSDDSSLSFCLVESLINIKYNNKGDFNVDGLLNDLSINMIKWYNESYWTAHNGTFDVGNSTRNAIELLIQGVNPKYSGSNLEQCNGNGSLMRILPLALYSKCKLEIAERYELIKQISSITHSHELSIFCCYYYITFARLLMLNKNKLDKQEIYNFVRNNEYLIGLKPDIDIKLMNINFNIWEQDVDSIKSSGYVLDTLEASIYCFITTNNYKDAVLKAVNLGGDTDTIASITGGLAGIYYGYDNIPQEWINQLARKDDILDLAERFTTHLIN